MKFIFQNLFNSKLESIDKIVDFICKNNLFIDNGDFHINRNNKNQAKYSFVTKEINIPANFEQGKLNKKLIDSTKLYVGNNAIDFIVAHEIGHAIHHQSLIKKEKYKNYINIKTKLDINMFIYSNSTLNEFEPIEAFIHSNFAEAYADCYAALILYLNNNEKDSFSKIYNYRKIKYKQFKTAQLRFLYDKNHRKCEIYQGMFGITRYSNFYSLASFKKNVIDCIDKEKLMKLPYEHIHNLIQIEIMNGLYISLLKEIKDNALFFKDMNNFVESKKISIKEFFSNFKILINNLKKESIYNEIYNMTNIDKYIDVKKNIDPKIISLLNDEKIELLNQLLASKDDLSLEKFKKELLSILIQKKDIDKLHTELIYGTYIGDKCPFKILLGKDDFNYIKVNLGHYVNSGNLKIDIKSNDEIIKKCKQLFSNEDLYKFKKLIITSISTTYLLQKNENNGINLLLKFTKFKEICNKLLSKKNSFKI